MGAPKKVQLDLEAVEESKPVVAKDKPVVPKTKAPVASAETVSVSITPASSKSAKLGRPVIRGGTVRWG